MSNTYKVEYVVCPWCGGKSGQRIDHLYDGHFLLSWGPWECKKCKRFFHGVADVQARSTTVDKFYLAPMQRCISLLRYEHDANSADFFIIDDVRSLDEGDDNVSVQRHMAFLYEEHDCPVNWLRKCVAVIRDNDCDPHGLMNHVRSIDVDADFDAEDDDQWLALFPEAFSFGVEIDGDADALASSPSLMCGHLDGARKDMIKEFIDALPAETIQECYVRNAARAADDAITARPDLRAWHMEQAEKYRKLSRRK